MYICTYSYMYIHTHTHIYCVYTHMYRVTIKEIDTFNVVLRRNY